MSMNNFFGEAQEEKSIGLKEDSFDKEAWVRLKQAEREAIKETLPQQLEAIRDDKDWLEAFLDLMARLGRKYSTRNLVLISAQCPEAVKLADYESWSQKGYRINKGERAVLIYEPAEISGENGEKRTVYNVRQVFDISQTNAALREEKELPFTKSQILNAIAGSSPWRIIPDKELEAAVRTDAAAQEIRIRKGAAPKEIFGRLLREVLRARIELRDDITPGPQSVFAASAGAYVLSRRYRLEAALDDFPALIKPAEEVKGMETAAFEKLLDVAGKAANHLSRSMSRLLGEKETEKGEGVKGSPLVRRSSPRLGGEAR